MIKPILDRILCKRIAPLEAPSSLIEVPQQYQQKSNRCEVVALGDFVVLGNQAFPIIDFIEVGDVIIVGDYNNEEVKIDGVDYILVNIHDVRGKDVANV